MSLLALDDVSTFYGETQILRGLSLVIDEGETVCLLGRNGRGKTTTIKSILGLAPIRGGSIWFEGAEITRLETHLIAARGITWVPDNRRIFPTLTVERNLTLALNFGAGRDGGPWTLHRVYERIPSLTKLRHRNAEFLSGGEAQLVAIARALLLNPKLILLDEPSQGLAPKIVGEVVNLLEDVQKEGIAILLVEQDSTLALSCSNRAYVIDDGRIVHSSRSAELMSDPDLTRRLLAV
jgi:branched-chain amino acid transport system ATP-binding protein